MLSKTAKEEVLWCVVLLGFIKKINVIFSSLKSLGNTSTPPLPEHLSVEKEGLNKIIKWSNKEKHFEPNILKE